MLTPIILAAGKGSRMASTREKVLHSLAGMPLIEHVLRTAESITTTRPFLVTREDQDTIRSYVGERAVHVQQAQPLGTGHAVLSVADIPPAGDVIILYGDTPLLSKRTLEELLAMRKDADMAILGMHVKEDNKYGRIICSEDGRVQRIMEHTEYGPGYTEPLCNSGIMCGDASIIWALLREVEPSNSKGEYYLTDIVSLGSNKGYITRVYEGEVEELSGVNTQQELASLEALCQKNLREKHMAKGVTLVAPESVYFSIDTCIESGTYVEPNVHMGPGVYIEKQAHIRSFSYLEGCHIGRNACVGPFARIRPGTDLASHVKIGNFVEIKQTHVASGSKIGHLSYVGDAEIAENVNIGAGTITCNYDGYSKHKTYIGAGAFIGSNTSLIAPISIGKGSLVGAGSVISNDVPHDGLAVARGQQRTVVDGAKKRKKRRSETCAES